MENIEPTDAPLDNGITELPKYLSDSPGWRKIPLIDQQLILEDMYPPGSPWHGNTEVGYLLTEEGDQ